MSRLRVLWLSNKILSEKDSGTTGTWLDAMAQALVRSGELQLGNITQGKVACLTRQDCGAIQQWLVPAHNPGRDGLPSKSVVAGIVKAVEEFSPDLIHVWGTESYWGLLTARGMIHLPALLETQGLKGAIARVFAGGLSTREQMECTGLKEIVRGKTIFQMQSQFERWGAIEREMLQKHRFITVQSQWLRAQIQSVNPSGTIFYNDFLLREPFYSASPWKFSNSKKIFCSSAYAAPFKGVHMALHTLAILKQHFPDIELRIAGAYQRAGIRQEGYVRWLNRQIDKLNVANNVQWLGAISAERIACELQNSATMLLPSYVEGYSLALAEGMLLGIPTVNSFVGGLPSLARDEDSALFFPAGDAEMCAYQLERLLTDRALAERIGQRAREIALERNAPERIVRNQIEIYRQVLANTRSDNQDREQ